MYKHKLTKFKRSDNPAAYFRVGQLNDGRKIVFGIAWTELAQLEERVNFDEESDKVAKREEFKQSSNEHFIGYQWINGIGFLITDPKTMGYKR